MAFEYVVVKEEFDLKEDAKIEVLSALEKNEPECNNINNKVEIAVIIPNNTRIKTEIIDPPRSPDGSQASNASWLVPITEEVKEVLPEKYLEVTIKEEVPESEDDQPSACEDISSDGSVDQQAPTSSDELDHQQSGGFPCDICGKRYANSAFLQRHLQFHSKNAVQCNQCNRQFLNKLRLNTHIFNRHTLVTSYPCDQCPNKFKSKYYLKEHKKIHSDEKPYQCSKCTQRFSVKRNLEGHLSRNNCKKLSEDPIKCKICDNVFENESLLKSHMKEHDEERPFPCEECSTTFKHKSTLIRHMHVHTGIRPYPCPHCGKTFTSSGLLKPHLRVHTGEKPYTCKLCDKKFGHKHNMQRHMLGHEKIKHTVCDICHKEFPRESRLKYHMKTHVNEKYFMCKVCPKRFSHKQNVLRHYTRKHPGQTYQCTDTDASVAAKVWDTMKKRFCDEETEEILG